MSPEGREIAKHDLGICKSIRAESVGRPGERYFRLRADAEQGAALLWLEKEQLYELAVAIERMMEREAREVRGDAPDSVPAGGVAVDHEFKISRMALGRDQDSGAYLLLIHVADEERDAEVVLGAPDFALRIEAEQLDRLADEAFSVCAAGRPRCPLCGAPLPEGEDHICPRSNGHHHS
jgi:uncharacterized repeat protein (TIGR03847 family)